jgi:tetratricopeptide (TPR) repeat protein
MSFARVLLIIIGLIFAVSAAGQEVRTQEPCSPVVDRTQGNVTITFSGGCTVGITPVQLQEIIDKLRTGLAIPPELLDRYDALSKTFGVTDTALTNFFHILGEDKIATADLDAKLREIAGRHVTLLRRAEASTDDDPRVATIKKEAIAAIAAGDYLHAEELLQRAFDDDLAVARRAQDAANKQYLTAAKTRADLGELKLTQLRYAAAAQDFQEAANLVPAGEPLVRSGYLANLGSAALIAGNYPLANTALVETLSIQEKLLGPEDPYVAAALNNLAALYDDLGRYAEAEPLFKRTLAIDEKALGPEHPSVATSLNNLAELHRHQGRYGEAEPLFKRALAIDEKALGPEHPSVAIRLNNLALLYKNQGRYAEASPLYERALAIHEKALGPEHPSVATSLNNLAALYEDQGRYAEAEPLFKRALAIDEKALGPEHPSVAIRLNNLAELYRHQSRYGEAESLYKRALAIDEKALGPEHPHTKSIRENLRLMQDKSKRSKKTPGDARPEGRR